MIRGSPTVPGFRELFDFRRKLRGEIVRFGAIYGEIIEFPIFVIEGDEFPCSLTHRAISLMFKKQGAVICRLPKLRYQISARQVEFPFVDGLCGDDGSREEIYDMGGFVIDGAGRSFESGGPMEDTG